MSVISIFSTMKNNDIGSNMKIIYDLVLSKIFDKFSKESLSNTYLNIYIYTTVTDFLMYIDIHTLSESCSWNQ